MFVDAQFSPNNRFFASVEKEVIRVYRQPVGKEESIGWRWWVDPDYPWHREQAEES